MSLVKTSELIGPTLDWAVAKCEGLQRDDPEVEIYIFRKNYSNGFLHYSTDWSQGGPIINLLMRKGLTIHGMKCRYESDATSAVVDMNGYYRQSGPTPLIAAMRCYIASKLGDTVEIPDELL